MGTDFIKLDEMQEYLSLAAGAGDFNRTVFERSAVINASSDTAHKYSFHRNKTTLCKFIAPKTGIYKYEFSYNSLEMTEFNFINVHPNVFPYVIYYNSGLYYAGYNKVDSYVSETVGITTKTEISVIGSGGSDPFRAGADLYPLLKIDIENLTSGFKNQINYFMAEEGQAIVIHLYWHCSASNLNRTLCSVKNQKITY